MPVPPKPAPAIAFTRRADPLTLGKEFKLRRELTPINTAKKVITADASQKFALLLAGTGAGLHLDPHALTNAELFRLEKELTAAFVSLYRIPSDLQPLPALTSWISANDTHWTLGRTLFIIVECHCDKRGMRTTASDYELPLLSCIDNPQLRPDPYGAVSDEEAIRKSIAAAGWLYVGRVAGPAPAKSDNVFKRRQIDE